MSNQYFDKASTLEFDETTWYEFWLPKNVLKALGSSRNVAQLVAGVKDGRITYLVDGVEVERLVGKYQVPSEPPTSQRTSTKDQALKTEEKDMRTNIQKMVAATVCNICREEISEFDETREANAQTDFVSFDKGGEYYDFHKACLADYKFPDPNAVRSGAEL